MIGQNISHYGITEKLGEDGIGIVSKTEDTKLQRPVAPKLPAAHVLKDEEARNRFDREAQAVWGLASPERLSRARDRRTLWQDVQRDVGD